MPGRLARLALLLGLMLGLAGSAGAATISNPGAGIHYQGDDSRDAFTVSAGPSNTVVFTRNDGAPLTAGAGCTQVQPSEQVSCGGMTNVTLTLAGGDDSAKGFQNNVPVCTVTVAAGAGDDHVEGSPCSDDIDGGPGNDTINPFSGDDKIVGGPDQDTIDPGLGADTVDGGDGSDTVLYPRAAGQAVRVTLDDVKDDGAIDENDNIRTTVENVVGGDGDDKLTGNAGSNRLEGGGGRDEIVGAAGADRLDGGAGDDVLDAGDSEPDEVLCGGGADAATVDGKDTPVTDCETVTNVDKDGDFSKVGQDCDDNNPAIRPGAPDVPDNGIDEDCDGRDAGDPDRDDDGVPRPLDCNDDSAAIRPGLAETPGNDVDENCDGIAAPFPRITSGVVNRWRYFARFTQVVRLTVRDAPVGALAEVRCRGRGCPRGVRRIRSRGGKELRFARFFGSRRIRVGATIEVRITLAGRIGKVVRYRIRPARKPRASVFCLPPGATRPSACPPGS